MGTIGIFGGAFDPIHIGHLRLVYEILDRLTLDQVRIVPTNTPPHKSKTHANGNDRCEIIRSVIKPPLVLDDREIIRGGTSYTIDTIFSVKSEYPEAEISLIIGEDAYLGIETWHKYETILEEVRLVVVSRPTRSHAINDLWEKHVHKYGNRSKAVFFDIPHMPVSSTEIRNKMLEGKSIKYWVPESGEKIIKDRKIYG